MSRNEIFTRSQYREAADAIRALTAHQPRIGLILGSGLSQLADEVAGADRIPFSSIPHFPRPTVPGHAGQLVLGELAGQDVVIMQGRLHAYEGLAQQQITFPVRVMHELGVHSLIVTNAAGGVNPAFQAGDLMLIVDHLGLAAMCGQNPLIGPNDETLGLRFVDMTAAYDPVLRQLAVRVAASQGIELRQGVYAGLYGPTYETPAEVRFLRLAGADAVGMSTVPEVIVARHMGLRVLGISSITNQTIADTDSGQVVSHEEVLAAGQMMVPKLMAVLRGVLAEMPAER